MLLQTYVMRDRVPVSFWRKCNPLWWLVGPDGWNVPAVNNGEPYLPEVKSLWLRRFYWFFCRNPLMNFVGYVLGVEDNNYRAIGPAPVLLTTWRDAVPPATGWKWAVLIPQFSLPAAVMAALFVFGAWFVHPAIAIAAVIAAGKAFGPLPFVSYFGGRVEFYFGWRPESGGLGFKLVWRA